MQDNLHALHRYKWLHTGRPCTTMQHPSNPSTAVCAEPQKACACCATKAAHTQRRALLLPCHALCVLSLVGSPAPLPLDTTLGCAGVQKAANIHSKPLHHPQMLIHKHTALSQAHGPADTFQQGQPGDWCKPEMPKGGLAYHHIKTEDRSAHLPYKHYTASPRGLDTPPHGPVRNGLLGRCWGPTPHAKNRQQTQLLHWPITAKTAILPQLQLSDLLQRLTGSI